MSAWLPLLAASPWAMPATHSELPSQTQILAQVAECGLKPPRTQVRAEPAMGGEDVIAISRGPALGLEQQTCLARASFATFAFVLFDDRVEQDAFYAVYLRMEQAEGLRRQRRG